VRAGLAWLKDHPEVKYVPGFDEPEDLNGWGMGLRFYYYQSLAKLLPHFDAKTRAARQQAIRAQIVELQQENGRWQNPSARMREDDPLIATCLAIAALGALAESA
jgi:hypothetical protein